MIPPKYLVPLALFVLPTLIIGYAIVLPRNGAAGLNELSVGFGSTVLGAAITYLVGVRQALRR